MKATDDLQHEHRVIELVLSGLEGLADQAEEQHQVDDERAGKALEVLRNFADRCHHGKEERHLFSLMAARGVPQEGGPLGVMLREHDEGRRHLRAIAEALPAAARGDELAARVFATNARAYVALLRQHIVKEDTVLYPIAERVLTAEDDQQLMQGFDAIERDEMGEGAHERYHQWAHELAGADA
jgi:hemerythrin-like domain-containing protein